jgi:threonine dehydrogenase-like Zn-dependent dehydrogenase
VTPPSMRAAVLVDVGRIEIRDIPVVAPGSHDVLVRVVAVGICGTDFHIFRGHGNYNTDERGVPVPLARHPQVLGHEIVGVVEECGNAVTDLRPGVRVVVDQGINCHSAGRPLCEYCASGDSHQCAAYQEHGITGLQGALAEFITVPAVNAIPLTATMASAHVALTEPLGCIVHSSAMVARAHTRYALQHADPGRRVRTVLVSGAGPAGLLFIQYLRKAVGWDGTILVSEPNALKRSLAARFGAEPLDPAGDLVEAVRDRTEGRRIEYLIDASGAGELFTQIPGLLRKQGTALLYGHGHAGVDLSVMNNVQFLEPALVSPVGASGGFLEDRRPATYRRALDLIEGGLIEPGPIVTHRYTSLDAVPEALGGAHRAPDYVKGVVELEEP